MVFECQFPSIILARLRESFPPDYVYELKGNTLSYLTAQRQWWKSRFAPWKWAVISCISPQQLTQACVVSYGSIELPVVRTRTRQCQRPMRVAFRICFRQSQKTDAHFFTNVKDGEKMLMILPLGKQLLRLGGSSRNFGKTSRGTQLLEEREGSRTEHGATCGWELLFMFPFLLFKLY